MRRKPIKGMAKAIRDFLNKHNGIFSVQEVREYIKRNLILTSEQNDITYGQPNWHHSVRKQLSNFVKYDEIIRVEHGKYVKNKN